MIVRDAGPEEAARIYAITRSAFLEYASDVPPPSALLETEAEVVSQLRGGRWNILVAEREGRALGCVRYEIDRKGLHFARLAVLPSARRQGVASSLMARLEEIGRDQGVSRIWCHVRTKVERNRMMYERAGYRLVSEDVMVKGGFAIPVGVMAKDLQSVG